MTSNDEVFQEHFNKICEEFLIKHQTSNWQLVCEELLERIVLLELYVAGLKK